MHHYLTRFIGLFFIFCSLSSFAQSEKLIFAIDLIRHGDRTPIINLPTAPYTWQQGLGQLTAQGMQQEFQLGKTWKKRYIQQQHLLPKHYEAQTIFVRSTDYDRTLMSAQSALLGLYPLGTGPQLAEGKPALEGAYQPIPIHTIPSAQDKLLLVDRDKQEYQQLLQRHVFSRSDWKAKSAELEPQFKRWTHLSGINITGLGQVILLGDILYIRQLYQLPLPPGMTEKDAKTIIDAGQWAFKTIYQTKALAELIGKPLLAAINQYLEAASKADTKLKWVLFSAHDNTISSLMSTLGAPLANPPPYASDLNIALYELKPGSYRVKVTFNGQAINIPTCGGTLCTH